MKSWASVVGFARYRVPLLLSYLFKREYHRRYAIAAKVYKTSRLRVMLRILRLAIGPKFTAEDAFHQGLANPHLPYRVHRGHMSKGKCWSYLYKLNPYTRAAVDDKWLFHVHCRTVGLPTAQIEAVLAPPYGWRASNGEPIVDWPQYFAKESPDEFVIKICGGSRGRGFRLIRRKDERFEEPDGTEHSAESLFKAIAADEQARSWLIERRLRNHPDLEHLTGSQTLQTLRIITLLHQGRAEVIDAYMRIAGGDALVDNIASGDNGNFVGLIDPASGMVRSAVAPTHEAVCPEPVELHPRTDESVIGFRIPMWEQVQQLVDQAAWKFMPFRALGWDIAVTPTGPVLIEANGLWDPRRFRPYNLLPEQLRDRPEYRLPEIRKKLQAAAETLSHFPDVPAQPPHAVTSPQDTPV